MKRFKILHLLSLVLTVFLLAHPSAAQESPDQTDGLIPADFDEAVQVLESSTRETYELWIDHWRELQQEHDVSLSELGAELAQSSELQARMAQMEQSATEIRGRTTEAAKVMLNPIYRDRLVAYLESADTLSLQNFLNYAAGIMMIGDRRDDWESSRTSGSDLVRDNPRLQDRLVRLMYDERSVLALAMPENKQYMVAELFGDQDPTEWGLQVGHQALFPVMQLLPSDVLTRTLAEATRPGQLDRLPGYLEELIEAGTLSMLGELPFDWLVEQVESGSLIWLNSLAMAEEGVDHPLLFEHFDQLDRSQQLRLIAIRPQPEFLPALRDAWQDAMDAAWCDGCMEPVEKDQIENLLSALMAWQTDESAEMLTGLMSINSYAEIVKPWRWNIASTAMDSESDAFVRLGMNLARQDDTLPINSWVLRRLHQFDADGLLEIISKRIDLWSDNTKADQQPLGMGGFQCQRAALALYAEGQGISVNWQQWMPSSNEDPEAVYDPGCVSTMTSAAFADPDTTAPLVSLLTEMEATEASADRYDTLVTMARRSSGPTREQRDLLAVMLIDHTAWESLSERNQDWLLGIERPSKSNLSCESSDPLMDTIADG